MNEKWEIRFIKYRAQLLQQRLVDPAGNESQFMPFRNGGRGRIGRNRRRGCGRGFEFGGYNLLR